MRPFSIFGTTTAQPPRSRPERLPAFSGYVKRGTPRFCPKSLAGHRWEWFQNGRYTCIDCGAEFIAGV